MKRRVATTRWVAGGLIAALALGLVTIGWISLYMPPTKAQFTAAKTQITQLRAEQSTLDSSTQDVLSATVNYLRFQPDGKELAVETKEQQVAYEQNLKQYQKRVQAFIGSAVSRDEEVKTHMQNIDTLASTYTDTLSRRVTSYATYYRAQIACDALERFVTDTKDLTKVAVGYDALAKKCQDELMKLATVSFSPMARYGKESTALITRAQKIYDTFKKDGNTERVIQASKELRTDQLQLQADFTKPEQDALSRLDDTLDSLNTLLEKKINE